MSGKINNNSPNIDKRAKVSIVKLNDLLTAMRAGKNIFFTVEQLLALIPNNGASENIANADLESDADHVWLLQGHSMAIANIGEYFAIGNPEMGGGMVVSPGDSVGFSWVDDEDSDFPIYANQVAIGSKESQIAVIYNENKCYSWVKSKKDLVEIRVRSGNDIDGYSAQVIQITPNGINIVEGSINIKSPDGTYWKIKVADDGTLSTEAVV